MVASSLITSRIVTVCPLDISRPNSTGSVSFCPHIAGPAGTGARWLVNTSPQAAAAAAGVSQSSVLSSGLPGQRHIRHHEPTWSWQHTGPQLDPHLSPAHHRMILPAGGGAPHFHRQRPSDGGGAPPAAIGGRPAPRRLLNRPPVALAPTLGRPGRGRAGRGAAGSDGKTGRRADAAAVLPVRGSDEAAVWPARKWNRRHSYDRWSRLV